MSGQIVPKRFGLKYSPKPAIALEYQEPDAGEGGDFISECYDPKIHALFRASMDIPDGFWISSVLIYAPENYGMHYIGLLAYSIIIVATLFGFQSTCEMSLDVSHTAAAAVLITAGCVYRVEKVRPRACSLGTDSLQKGVVTAA